MTGVTGTTGTSRANGVTRATPPDSRLAIYVRGLRKRYRELTVLDGLDLEVQTGAVVALLGPNGAGKTTTVEILEGYRSADGGEVRVLGLDPRRAGGALRPRVGVMLQHGGITPAARPRELVRLHARLFADPADPDGLLDLLGLAHVATRRYKLLSGGEKQRLALAVALVGRPELLILDEPTAGMDPAAKATVRALIGDLRAAGRTILLTTHELADVERLADHVVLIDRGRVLAAGTPAELVAESTPALRFRLATAHGHDPALDPEVLAGLGAALGGTIENDGAAGRQRLAGREPDPRAVAILAAWCAERGLLLAEMRTTGGTLEERFLELIAKPAADRPGVSDVSDAVGGTPDGDTAHAAGAARFGDAA
ncbi:MAG TPA: ABC transporter ATP-binding protein [Patescibacteria group bacterium]|nr:ABC transporter ATP-binding protein [Patescibacteria group bacterium]